MHTKRIIPCLDIKDGRVVKGINFVNLRDAGDPADVAAAYTQAGADEVVFLDITASSDSRTTQLEWVREVASRLFIPFTVGGGIRTVEDFREIRDFCCNYASGSDIGSGGEIWKSVRGGGN